MIKCTECNTEKILAEIVKDSSKKSGYKNLCKACFNKRSKEYREANNGAYKQKKKQYHEEHKEQRKESNKKYKEKNKEKIKQYNSVMVVCPECKKEVMRKNLNMHKKTHDPEESKKMRYNRYKKDFEKMLSRHSIDEKEKTELIDAEMKRWEERYIKTHQ
jgi:hypothetical protein